MSDKLWNLVKWINQTEVGRTGYISVREERTVQVCLPRWPEELTATAFTRWTSNVWTRST